MKITKFIIEYKDLPVVGDKYRKFGVHIRTDTNKELEFERAILDDDFTSILDRLFDDAKFQINKFMEENEHE